MTLETFMKKNNPKLYRIKSQDNLNKTISTIDKELLKREIVSEEHHLSKYQDIKSGKWDETYYYTIIIK